MKTTIQTFAVIIVTVMLIVSCGYRNPYVYSGPDKTIYATSWNNRTNELTLDSKIYQSLIKWFQKSGSLKISKEKEAADYILAGEIISIDLPSLTFGSSNSTSEVKIKLKVRYIMKDLKSGKILIEQPSEVWTEEYTVESDASASKDNENEALDTIIDELAQKIYQDALTKFSAQ
ncbi:MAG: hypothetical protein D6B25_06190 [Desulfobulbaceae bacterium]|nr:MAG: hypothetical protein D6B25_06190 [Desulfobulbaceae bacterium]